MATGSRGGPPRRSSPRRAKSGSSPARLGRRAVMWSWLVTASRSRFLWTRWCTRRPTTAGLTRRSSTGVTYRSAAPTGALVGARWRGTRRMAPELARLPVDNSAVSTDAPSAHPHAARSAHGVAQGRRLGMNGQVRALQTAIARIVGRTATECGRLPIDLADSLLRVEGVRLRDVAKQVERAARERDESALCPVSGVRSGGPATLRPKPIATNSLPERVAREGLRADRIAPAAVDPDRRFAEGVDPGAGSHSASEIRFALDPSEARGIAIQTGRLGLLSSSATGTLRASAAAARSSTVHCVRPVSRADIACRLTPRAVASSWVLVPRRAIHTLTSIETILDSRSLLRAASTLQEYRCWSAHRSGAQPRSAVKDISC